VPLDSSEARHKEEPQAIDAWGVASICRLETGGRGVGAWGAAQSLLAANRTLKHK
jgi:hypothetical protein